MKLSNGPASVHPHAPARHAPRLLAIALAISSVLAATAAPARDVVTVAGGSGNTGDGGAATAAYLQQPESVAVAPDGTTYVSQGWASRVRRIDGSTGVITHFAGNGSRGWDGDAGDAVDAAIGYPLGLVVDADGNVFISDNVNAVVRRVATDGTISTVAGNGTTGYSGDGGDGTSAQLSSPSGLAVDAAGNLYITDTGNSVIRRVDAGTGVITTVAGTGTAGYSGDGGLATAAELAFPQDIAIDADDNLLIADSSNVVIRRVDAVTQEISTLLGAPEAENFGNVDVPPLEVAFGNPQGVAVSASGDIYVVDRAFNSVRRFDGSSVDLVAGSGLDPVTFITVNGYSGDGVPAAGALLNSPSDLAVLPGGDVLVADGINHRIRRVVPGGNISTFAGGFALLGDGGPAEDANVMGPYDLAFDPDGNLFFTDRNGQALRRIDGGTGEISTVAGSGLTGLVGGPALSAKMWGPTRLMPVTADIVAVLDRSNHALRFLTEDGDLEIANTALAGFAGDGGPMSGVRFRAPNAIALLPGSNYLYIADTNNHRIRRWDFVNDVVTTIAGGNGAGSTGDGGAATAARISAPFALTFDGDGNLYFLELAFGRVRRITPGGTISTIAGTGTPGYSGDGGPAAVAQLSPHSLAYDGDSRLYVSQNSNCAIRVIELGSGVIDTFAGNGSCFPDPDGPALSTGLAQPFGIAWHGDSLYMAEIGNSRIRKVQPGAPTPPLSPYATAGAQSAFVQFSGPASNDGSPVTGYTVSSIPAGGVDEDAGTLGDTHHVTGLTDGESYTFVVVATNAYGTSAASTESNTIVPHTPPTLSLADVSVVEGNSGYKLVTFVATLSGPATQAVTFDYATADGSAVSPGDFIAATGSSVIAIGDTSTSFTVRVNGDTAVEANEVFSATLSNPIGATIADGSGDATIINNDGPVLTVGNRVVAESLTVTRQMAFTVSLSTTPTSDVTFDFATSDGSATAGSDYAATAGSGLIPAGSRSTTFSVPIAADTLVEGDESFEVHVTNMTGGSISDGDATGTITDAGAAALNVADVTVAESRTLDRTATFSVRLSAPASAPVTFDIATADGSATAGADYVARSVTGATIPVGATTYSFPVTVSPDTAVEGTETFAVAVTNVSGANLVDGNAAGNITDAGGVVATIADVSLIEGQTGSKAMTFTVRLGSVSTAPVLFDVATSAGSATSGVDYAAAAYTDLEIPAGSQTRTFTVQVNGDVEPESSETFFVDIGNVRGAVMPDPQAIGTIRDGGVRTASITDRTIVEGNTGQVVMAFTVRLSSLSDTPVTFDAATVAGSAQAGSDFVPVNAVGLTIPAGVISRGIAVKINGDTLVEGDEQLQLVISNMVGASIPDGTATGTITDND